MTAVSVEPWTAGPWQCDGTRIKDAVGEEVAVATKASPTNRHRAIANARLIAASPKLYLVLDYMADLFQGLAGDPTTETGWATDEYLQLWMSAMDALREARGESA